MIFRKTWVALESEGAVILIGPPPVGKGMVISMDKEEKQSNPKIEQSWRGKAYSFFTNTKCEAFPCHPTNNIADFNCLFCFCPLYVLGENCGGNFRYIGNGIKDCSRCLVPHKRDNYGIIIERFGEILKMMKRST